MIVCICRRVSDHQIRSAAAGGAFSLECLQFDLGVATQCGRCAECASKVLCEARAVVPDAVVNLARRLGSARTDQTA